MIPGSRAALLKSGATRYNPYGVLLDGTNDYVSRGAALTGVSDSRTFLIAFSIRLDSATNPYVFAGQSNNFLLDFAAGSNGLRLTAYNVSNSVGLSMSSSIGFSTSNTTWYKIIIAGDVDNAANNKIYANDADVTVLSTRVAGTNLKFSSASAMTDWLIGCTSGGANRANIGLADFYFAPGQWLDLSVTANRRKFFDAAGNPVYLGATGTLPTGTQPAILLQNPAASWGTNSGSGGNLTITGALDSITGP